MVSSELSAKMAVWRAKALTGELSTEEMKEAIIFMRGERMGASQTAEQRKRTKAKKEIPNADDLLKELGL